MAHFVTEKKFVPADEDLSQPFQDLCAVEKLMANQLFAGEEKDLRADGRGSGEHWPVCHSDKTFKSVHVLKPSYQSPFPLYLISQKVSIGASGFHSSVVSG